MLSMPSILNFLEFKLYGGVLETAIMLVIKIRDFGNFFFSEIH